MSASILAYCFKDKKKTPLLNYKHKVNKAGAICAVGTCADCGTSVTTIVKASSAPPEIVAKSVARRAQIAAARDAGKTAEAGAKEVAKVAARAAKATAKAANSKAKNKAKSDMDALDALKAQAKGGSERKRPASKRK